MHLDLFWHTKGQHDYSVCKNRNNSVVNIFPLHTGNTPKLTLSNLFASENCTFLTRHNNQNDEKYPFLKITRIRLDNNNQLKLFQMLDYSHLLSDILTWASIDFITIFAQTLFFAQSAVEILRAILFAINSKCSRKTFFLSIKLKQFTKFI